MEPRYLDHEIAVRANAYRNTGDLKTAVRVVDEVLYPPHKPLTAAEINEIAKDQSQASVLGELARIKTDSSISLANRSAWPPTIIDHLGDAIDTIASIYQNDRLTQTLTEVRTPQNFLAEMRRDKAKAFQAMAQFYIGREKGLLLVSGENTLTRGIISLPDHDQVKNLMIVERAISQMDRGVTFDNESLVTSILALLEDETLDAQRRHTVAAWAKARQRQIDYPFVSELVDEKYQILSIQHPEYGDTYRRTLRKMRLQPLRSLVIAGVAKVTTFPGRIDTYRDFLLQG